MAKISRRQPGQRHLCDLVHLALAPDDERRVLDYERLCHDKTGAPRWDAGTNAATCKGAPGITRSHPGSGGYSGSGVGKAGGES